MTYYGSDTESAYQGHMFTRPTTQREPSRGNLAMANGGIQRDKDPPTTIFETLFNDPHVSDMVLRIGDSQFHVSKIVLARASEYFYKMLFGDFAESTKKEIELYDDDENAVETMLKFIYSTVYDVPPTQDFTFHAKIYVVADKYSVSGFRERIIDQMCRRFELLDGVGDRGKRSWGSPLSDDEPAYKKARRDVAVDAAKQREEEFDDNYEDLLEATRLIYASTTKLDKLARPLLAANRARRAGRKEHKDAVCTLLQDCPDLALDCALDLFDVCFPGGETKVTLGVCGDCGKAQELPTEPINPHGYELRRASRYDNYDGRREHTPGAVPYGRGKSMAACIGCRRRAYGWCEGLVSGELRHFSERLF